MRERCLLDAILAPGGLRVVFQPIFEVSPRRAVHAVECLARGPQDTNMESPDVLFEYVRRKREETLVDRACVTTALAAARRLPAWLPLTLNVHASTLGRDHGFPDFLEETAAECGLPLPRLVVEVVEHTPFWDGHSFQRALARLRGEGVRIALDDVGLGQSNYRMMLDCRPDYFKVDRYFVDGCHGDPYRRAVLQSLVHLAREFGGNVVAEGVERPEDLATVAALGVGLVQGFLLARAVPAADLLAGDLLRAEGIRSPGPVAVGREI